MKVELSVLDRLIALVILPKEENIVTLRIVKKLKEKLSFSEEEIKKYNIVEADGKYTWDDSFPGKEYDLGEKAIEILKAQLVSLDASKKLTEQHMSLYDKIVFAVPLIIEE